MIYCEQRNDYVEQDKKCVKCIFYKLEEDSCFYPDWYPGLKKGREWNEPNNN